MKKLSVYKAEKQSNYRYGCYNVGRTDIWGNYCPETGEYYLCCNNEDPIMGECVEVLASGREMPDGEWQEQSARGYRYEVVRELLQLGHLTSRTLDRFLEEGGEVWWDQPDFSL